MHSGFAPSALRCSRCKITTTDQATSVQGRVLGVDGVTPEPLATLSTFREFGKGKGNVYFGQNLVHEWPVPFWRRLRRWLQSDQSAGAVIRVGDCVEVRKRPGVSKPSFAAVSSG